MTLQNKLEKHSIGSHPDFRVYMSAEPAGTREAHSIPQGILENAIKITNEPPTGILANIHKALDNFNQVCNLLTCYIHVNTLVIVILINSIYIC